MAERPGFNNLQTLSDTNDLILHKTSLSFPGPLAQQSKPKVGAAPLALDEADEVGAEMAKQQHVPWAAGHHGVDNVSGSRAVELHCSCRASSETTV